MKCFIRINLLLSILLTSGLHLKGLAQPNSSIKLFRFGVAENEKPGIVTAEGKRYDVSSFGEDYDEEFFTKEGITRLEAWFKENKSKCPEVPDRVRIASCIVRPSKIVAIGLNYLEHVREGGTSVPKEPVIFLKATSSLAGPFDTVVIPRNSTKTDYEAELAIVIGKKASYVSQKDAFSYVAGYTIINDYSEREWQLERPAGQWDKGKSSDTFAPLGPYLVTPSELGNPQNLGIWLSVNGQKVQESNTREMIFPIERLISEVSRYMTLFPGDVIATGTPSGVGLGQKPQKYLKPGDVVELGIEKLGTQKQKLISYIQFSLGEDAYKDYQAWVALGLGGIPHTFEGYQTVKQLGLQMKDPLDVSRVAKDIGSKGDVKVLKNLPKRKGAKPVIAPFAVPHRQVDQHNDSITRLSQKKIFDDKVADPDYNLLYKLSYLEKHNFGIFLKDSAAGNQTVVPVSHAEVGHIHPTDGSMHIILSPSDTKEVITKGWGELHGLAGQGAAAKTYLMIYSPRDKQELNVTRQILDAAVRYSSYQVK